MPTYLDCLPDPVTSFISERRPGSLAMSQTSSLGWLASQSCEEGATFFGSVAVWRSPFWSRFTLYFVRVMASAELDSTGSMEKASFTAPTVNNKFINGREEEDVFKKGDNNRREAFIHNLSSPSQEKRRKQCVVPEKNPIFRCVKYRLLLVFV